MPDTPRPSRWDREVRLRLGPANLAPVRENEIARELTQHLEDRYAELRAAGTADDEAERVVLAELREEDVMRLELSRIEAGAADQVVPGETRQRSVISDVWQDVRYAVRVLATNRGFTAVAVLTLALGTGATTAIFSIVDAMLIRPLAYDPEARFVQVFHTEPRHAPAGSQTAHPLSRMVPSVQTFNELRSRNDAFDTIALFRFRELTLLDSMPVERTRAYAVSPGFFDLFDGPMVLGRRLTEADEQERVTVITYGCWQRRYGGSREVIGTTVRILEGSRTIVGVLPAEFSYMNTVDFWIPLDVSARLLTMPGWGGSVLARLKPEASLREARARMGAITLQLKEEGALQPPDGLAIEPHREWTVLSARSMLYVLTGAVTFILLIACVNVAGLLIARGAGRHREMAIRASLGASRWRLARQLLTESIVLALIGGGLGAVLAWWTLNSLVPMLPVSVPADMSPSVNVRVLAFTLIVSCATGVVFGAFPAVRVSRGVFANAMKEASAGSVQSGGRTGSTLIVIEVALALVLLVGAGLMLRSLQRLLSIDPGFQAERVLVVEAFPVITGEGAPVRARNFYTEAVSRLSALPGVESVSGIDDLPFWSTTFSSVEIEGRQPITIDISPRYVLPDYFKTFGIPLHIGREFTQADREGAACVAIVNGRLARQQWPTESPLGRRVRYGKKAPWCEIVGVAGDVRHQSLERETLPEVYLSALQSETIELTLVLRAHDPSSLVQLARGRLTGLPEPALVGRVVPFETLVARSVGNRQRRASLLSLLGGLGLLLACVGVFGLTAYAVARRTPEIGVRMALGANGRQVLATVVGGFAAAIAVGVACGLFGAWAATRLISQYLFGVEPTDPLTLAAASLLLVTVALLACYLPARRALRVDPVIALRAE